MRLTWLTVLTTVVSLASAVEADLVAYYPFSGNAYDASGNGHHATLVEGATLTGLGHEGSAYEFDGVFGRIVVPVDIGPTAMPRMTMGCWVNADVADLVVRGVLTHDDGVFDRGLDVDVRDGTGLRWSAFAGHVGGVVGGDLVVPGEWVFLAVTYDQAAGETRFWVDDQPFTRVSSHSDGEAQLTIGRNPNFDFVFDGRIDDVFIYDDVLSDVEIADIRANGRAAILGPELKVETFTRRLGEGLSFQIPPGPFGVVGSAGGQAGVPAFDPLNGERHLHRVVQRVRTTYDLLVVWNGDPLFGGLDCSVGNLTLAMNSWTALEQNGDAGTCDGVGSAFSLSWAATGEDQVFEQEVSLLDHLADEVVMLGCAWSLDAYVQPWVVVSSHVIAFQHDTVVEVEYHYTGADSPWTDLGGELLNLSGLAFCLPVVTPTVTGHGSLLPGEPTRISLAHGEWGSLAYLTLSTAVLGAAFKGGTLYPDVGVGLITPLVPTVSPLDVEFPWPMVPPGTQLVAQYWFVDPEPTGCVIAPVPDWIPSNGLLATSP